MDVCIDAFICIYMFISQCGIATSMSGIFTMSDDMSKNLFWTSYRPSCGFSGENWLN